MTLQMKPITNEFQDVLSHNKNNTNIIRVGYTILATSGEASIEENGCLLDNQPTYKAFINGKYMSNIRDSPDGKYPRVHFNA